LSVRELAQDMVKLALEYPEYKASARKVRIVKTTADKYYGKGYQDMQNRVPRIANTKAELNWRPRVGMQDALRRIFDSYRTQVAAARGLMK
jgi:nucleoside-diphosphate-sugar epimerase